jgi:hypothetical protein
MCTHRQMNERVLSALAPTHITHTDIQRVDSDIRIHTEYSGPFYVPPLPEAPASVHCSVAGLSTSRGHSVHLLSSEHTSATTARGSCSATWVQNVQNILSLFKHSNSSAASSAW